MSELNWSEFDDRAVDTARVLAADAVQKVGNGHPGTAISLAPLAYLLYQKVMKTDPTDHLWLGRDRFILSAGHASILQYVQLYMGGCGLGLDDLKSLRTVGSATPGHPEYHHTDFIECTTGPLGAGVSNAVGMAMAVRRQRGLFDPDAPEGESPFDHFIYCVTGDGCMQEGVQAEAASLAGVQELGNLIMIYDDNHITIEGKTKISFGEDVCARYTAYGWHVQQVDWTNGGTEYREDIQALYDAIEAAKAVTDKPSLIKLTTIIGWPLPNKQGLASVHGSALGGAEITALKEAIGFDDEAFGHELDLVEKTQAALAERGKAQRAEWDEKFAAWEASNAEGAALLARVANRELPDDLTLPTFDAGKMSTRKASGMVLSALADQLPELWGGSADLAGSNNTTMDGQPSFLPAHRSTAAWKGDKYGRTLHFGVREHAMGGILNGINLEALTRAYGGTFLVFSDYMRPPVRLAALMEVPSIFVWSHDSVGVGEDGPTHQPIEHLAALRAIPQFHVVRPGDANETAVVWHEILKRAHQAAGIILTRQDVRTLDRTEFAPAEGAARGAYVLKDAEGGDPELIIIATGSEVEVAVDAAAALEGEGVRVRVVSMPCQEWFDEQDEAYRESVLPAGVQARVSVEAGIAMGWAKYVGCNGASVSIEHYGASGDGVELLKQFGFNADNVAKVAREVLAG